ncbi:beta-propeller fold lactonase family protein [bacterium]|nr:beta-propeller fold lactonase family protein [bacterium]
MKRVRLTLFWGLSLFAFLTACSKHAVESPGTLIVLNKSGASATLISLDSNEQVANVATGIGPHEVAVSDDGRIAVVTNYGNRDDAGSSLTVIDLEKREAEKTIDLGAFERPHGIVFSSDGSRLLVTAEAQKMLLVVNLMTGEIEHQVETGQNTSHMVARVPETDLAFVANIRSGNVTVIDLAQAKVVKQIETGAGAEGIDVSPDGGEVWVSNRAADTISIIDAKSLAIIETLESKSFPIRAKFTPDGRHVLVSNARSGDVAVFDAKSRQEVARIDMNEEAIAGKESRLFSDQFGESPVPVGILAHPNGRTAYVANTNADIVTVLDLSNWTVSGRLATGKEPDGLGFTPLQTSALTVK